MSNEYELALDNRQDLIYTKEQLIAPLLPGMEAPPHAMRLGMTRRTTTCRSQAPVHRASRRATANVAAARAMRTGARAIARRASEGTSG